VAPSFAPLLSVFFFSLLQKATTVRMISFSLFFFFFSFLFFSKRNDLNVKGYYLRRESRVPCPCYPLLLFFFFFPSPPLFSREETKGPRSWKPPLVFTSSFRTSCRYYSPFFSFFHFSMGRKANKFSAGKLLLFFFPPSK